MNSRVSWSVDGIDPSVRERAEAAARRAGMSLSDWLNTTIGDSASPNFRAPYEQQPAMPSQESRDVADIHLRLDSITRQIDQISRPAPRNDAPWGETSRGEPTVARQLNDAISRLDARLSQISNAAPRPASMQERQRQAELVERAAAQVYRPSPPLSPCFLRFRDRRNRRAPERTRRPATPADAAAQRPADGTHDGTDGAERLADGVPCAAGAAAGAPAGTCRS